MRNPRFFLLIAAVLGFANLVYRADARKPVQSGFTCLPAPSGSVVKPKGYHENGRPPVSELA